MIAIYVRQSIDKKDSISIETQIEYCKRELEPGQECRVFQDKGYSGKNTLRPAFKELIKAIETREIEKVIVYRLDRISRSITDFANIIELLEEYKVDFVSTNEKFDTSSPVGRAMLYIIMVFAQLERETIAERVRDNYYARGKSGVWLGGPAPLGFNNIKAAFKGKNVAMLVPNGDIELVKDIFFRYSASSVSLGALAKIMREKNNGVMWNNIKLARILHNPAYVKADADVYRFYQYKKCIIVNDIEEFTGVNGCSLYGKRDRGANKYNSLEDQVLSLALHGGVVDSKTWLICQHKLSENRQIKNTGKGKHSWLTGILKCGYCGYGMVVKIYADYRYLVCSGHYQNDLCKEKLSTHYLGDVEEAVYCEIIKKVDEIREYGTSTNEGDVSALKIELFKVEAEIQTLIDSMSTANEILIKYVNEKIIELDERKNSILERINERVVETAAEIPNVDDWGTFDLSLKREITHNLINKIALFNDKIDIYWKI